MATQTGRNRFSQASTCIERTKFCRVVPRYSSQKRICAVTPLISLIISRSSMTNFSLVYRLLACSRSMQLWRSAPCQQRTRFNCCWDTNIGLIEALWLLTACIILAKYDGKQCCETGSRLIHRPYNYSMSLMHFVVYYKCRLHHNIQVSDCL